MIIPIKCFSCNKVLADKYLAYERAVAELEESGSTVEHPSFTTGIRGPILDKLGLIKPCCRRHMLGNVDFKN